MGAGTIPGVRIPNFIRHAGQSIHLLYGRTMRGLLLVFALVVSVAGAGCILQQSPEPVAAPDRTTPPIPFTTIPSVTTTAPPATPSATRTTPATTASIAKPQPTPTPISEAALNARMVDARNKLNNLIDSNVADTVIIHDAGGQGCEVKKSKELGYVIDTVTGESTFVKGDYWSINAAQFTDEMEKDREYVILHTHPRM
jgi:hypothetical protein